MLLRPPSSPLFPYTTLFRSWPGRGDCRSGRRVDVDGARVGDIDPLTEDPADGRRPGAIPPRGADARQATPPGRWVDRKSTRLNSSHRTISYAVFCLKKKKKD